VRGQGSDIYRLQKAASWCRARRCMHACDARPFCQRTDLGKTDSIHAGTNTHGIRSVSPAPALPPPITHRPVLVARCLSVSSAHRHVHVHVRTYMQHVWPCMHMGVCFYYYHHLPFTPRNASSPPGPTGASAVHARSSFIQVPTAASAASTALLNRGLLPHSDRSCPCNKHAGCATAS
jgi:hypothetical protein